MLRNQRLAARRKAFPAEGGNPNGVPDRLVVL
jgi:hypothetical protein